jgi:hypothetical protein
MSSDRFFQGQPFPTTDQCVTAVGGKTPSGTIFPIAVDAAGKVITASDPSSGSGLLYWPCWASQWPCRIPNRRIGRHRS